MHDEIVFMLRSINRNLLGQGNAGFFFRIAGSMQILELVFNISWPTFDIYFQTSNEKQKIIEQAIQILNGHHPLFMLL